MVRVNILTSNQKHRLYQYYPQAKSQNHSAAPAAKKEKK
ncbi:hypothetical protein BN1843_28300 [Escherichia coli]|nr:hypothetical protein BN1843_28300 [Escherichia coli]